MTVFRALLASCTITGLITISPFVFAKKESDNLLTAIQKQWVGQKAPAFKLQDQQGQWHQLSQYKGQWVVLYFYPKDNTSGCTAEACSLRDGYKELQAAGYEVVGVSKDSAKSHQGFIAKQELPFSLIADTDTTLQQQFGVWAEKKLYGRSYMGTLRTTFIIDEDGIVTNIIGPKEVKTKDHANQILNL
mgnify:CR=1 FL=1